MGDGTVQRQRGGVRGGGDLADEGREVLRMVSDPACVGLETSGGF